MYFKSNEVIEYRVIMYANPLIIVQAMYYTLKINLYIAVLGSDFWKYSFSLQRKIGFQSKTLYKAVVMILTFPLNREGCTIHSGTLKALFDYEGTK